MDKTRIKRRSLNEKVLVSLLAEDLQDAYTKLRDVEDEAIWATERLKSAKDGNDLSLWRDAHTKIAVHIKAYLDFWNAVRERYNLWNVSLGIRDGFCIVDEHNQQATQDFATFIRRILG